MTQTKLDALMEMVRKAQNAYTRACSPNATGFHEEASFEADVRVKDALRTLLEENERLLKVNDESAQELMDMCASWKQKHEALRVVAQAVVDADAKGDYDADPALWNAIDELHEVLK